MPSVEDNTKYKCNGCGAIYDFSSPAAIPRCRTCGKLDYDQIRITTVCDFCSRPEKVNWQFDADDFAMPLPVGVVSDTGSKGGWACCDDCKPLVEAEDKAGLLDRNITYSKMVADWKLTDPQLAELRTLVGMMHDAFFANKRGDAQPLDLEEP